MEKLNLSGNIKKRIEDFVQKLNNIYGDEIVSLIIYGSAASGEFLEKHSNINLLIVLKNAGLDNLNKSSSLINSYKFRIFKPLFITEEQITNSRDVFPIEFLDMKENYLILQGKDVLKDLNIDLRNLRFQCEQELKSKLLNLKMAYLRNRNSPALKNLLFKAFNSTLHVARNLVRLKGKAPSYKKEDVLKELTQEFRIETEIFYKILEAKNKNLRLSHSDTEKLFFDFATELEKIANLTDRL